VYQSRAHSRALSSSMVVRSRDVPVSADWYTAVVAGRRGVVGLRPCQEAKVVEYHEAANV